MPTWTDSPDAAAVRTLAAAAADDDGVAPLDEQTLLTLGRGRHLVETGADGLLGYATPGVDGTAELVVAPSARRRGLGARMLEMLAPQAVWAHGDLPAAAALAASAGLERGRVLRELALPLSADPPAPTRATGGATTGSSPADPVGGGSRPSARRPVESNCERPRHGAEPTAPDTTSAAGADAARNRASDRGPDADADPDAARGTDLPPAVWPDGVTVRTFVPGRDEETWLALNALAFAHHPEQGRWTAADLAAREAEDWFDPAGFFLAERDGRVVGFHWTKVADGLGEVYVVGVDPSAAGGGLGRALTLHGLHHLAGAGLPEVRLYVDDDNPRALTLYRHLGFADHHVDVTYLRR